MSGKQEQGHSAILADLGNGIICRQAHKEDVESIYELIDFYAQKAIMLPRSRELLHKIIDTFVVVEDKGKFVGCGSLTKLGKDLVEIRSLGIIDGYKGKGAGSAIVQGLVEKARQQKIPKIMALTYAVKFFEKNGFHVVSMEIFPEKVWKDCVHCPKQQNCDEIAVLKLLD
jgi:amino-acid N-acetyltransferase